MRVLIDLNVLIDVLARREPHYDASAQVWGACDQSYLKGFVPAVSVTNLHYIVGRLYGPQAALEAVLQVLSAFEILDTTRAELEAATKIASRDFEDNVMAATADRHGLDLIVTRDLSGFSSSRVEAVVPSDVMARLAKSTGRPNPDVAE